MKRQLFKRWKCGCLSLFGCNIHLKRGKVSGTGFKIHTCRQCKVADKVIDEIIREELIAKRKASGYYGVL